MTGGALHRVGEGPASCLRSLAIGLLLGAAVLALNATSASALSKHTFSTSFAGSGTSALSEPTDVAVDQSSGDIYVADPAQHRVEKFDSSGHFLLMFGAEVNATTHADVCTASETCQSGLADSSPGAFESTYRLFLAVDNTPGGGGDLYVGDRADSLVSKFDPSGHILSTWGTAGQLDGTTSGDLPFAGARDIEEPPGEPSIAAGRGLMGLAVSVRGDLLVIAGNTSHQLYRFTQGGSFVETFRLVDNNYASGINPVGFGVDPHEVAYLSRTGIENVSLERGATTRLAGPGGASPQGIAVDQASRDLYSASGAGIQHFAPSCEPVAGGVSTEDIHCTPSETFGAADLSQPNGVAVDEASQAVYVADTGNHRVAVFTPVPYLPAATPSAVAETPSKELLKGEVDPAGAGEVTTCHFEYAPQSAFANEVQNLIFSAATAGGTFTLTFEGETTGPIDYADLSTHDGIGNALRALPSIGPGGVKVEREHNPGGGFRYRLEFTGPFRQVNVPQLTGDFSDLTPSSAVATIATQTNGGGGWGSATTRECSPPPPYPGSASKDVSAEAPGLTYGTAYRLRIVAANATGSSTSFVVPFTTLPEAPQISAESVSETYAENVKVHAQINPGGGDTTYHVEYVSQQQFEAHEWAEAASSPELDAGSSRTPLSVTAPLNGLIQGTIYHYRVIAKNANGATTGADQTFNTLPFVPTNDTCPNAHVRQQTATAGLLDCRAYELVSAANAGGYDVESSLIPGQQPYGGYPQAQGRVLYGVHDGGIPDTNHPTNRGVDPYVATRGEAGWSTEYVGVPANNPFAEAPFSSVPSGADGSLETFAFGGPEGCSPCFEGESTGIPLHLPDGKLVQGMIGPEEPGPTAEPDGYIAKPLSANGEHLIFGSTALFAPGGNDETGDVSIYDRNLKTGQTHVVSNQSGSGGPPEALECLQGAGKCDTAEGDANGISELDVSNDGSHVLIGQKVSEDSAGNPYWHLYMEVNDSVNSIDLMPGATKGVLYDGMTSDGSKVFFSSEEHLTNEDTAHSGADIFMWEEASDSLTLITKGNGNSCEPVANSAHEHWNTVGSGQNCGAVAIGGGGGVSSANGSIYFLSPEKLDGSNGTENAPNLYVAHPGDGYVTHYVTTLESILTGPQPPPVARIPGHSFQASFTNATALAAEHQHGHVYVLDSATNTVEKFDSRGNPVNFNFPLGSNEASGNQLKGADTPAGSFSAQLFGFIPPTQLAVDQSTGDFYVPDGEHGVVDKFSSSGEYLSQVSAPFPAAVAVDPANGDLYVSSVFPNEVSIFESSGTPVSQFSLPSEKYPASIAVDSAGTVYVTYQPIFGSIGTEVFESSGKRLRMLDPEPAQSVAVDPSTDDVYVDEGAQLARYDASGKSLGIFGSGQLTGSVGLTIEPGGEPSGDSLEPGGNLYATTSGGTRISVFSPAFVPGPLIDNPAVLDSVSKAEARNTADFQVTPSGEDAVFPSALALGGKGEQTAGHTEVYRFDAPVEALDCVSCNPSGAPSVSEASLASNGLSLTDDGRVFFNTADPLVLADTDSRQDVYQWAEPGAGNCEEANPAFDKSTGDCLALVSAGTSAFDSGLLSATDNAVDAYFFTRDSLVQQDKNGPTMKIYDAREGGGFTYLPSFVPCKASDECHGASSPPPPPLKVGSESGTSHNFEEAPKPCKRGFVKKHGHCVKKPHPHGHKHHKRAVHHRRGGNK